jgi:hypothetical protein
MTQDAAAEEIRRVLDKYGVVGLLSERGERGELRVTFSGVFGPEEAGEIVDLVRKHTLARART